MKNIITILALSLFFINGAFAASASGSTKATATLSSTCSISASNINFGQIGGNGTNSANGGLSLLCTTNSTYTISLNLGLYSTSDNWVAKLSDISGNKIPYWICKNNVSATYTATSGCGSGSDWYTEYGVNQVVTGTGTGVTQTIPMYGYIVKGYYVPNSYSDTVTATVSY